MSTLTTSHRVFNRGSAPSTPSATADLCHQCDGPSSLTGRGVGLTPSSHRFLRVAVISDRGPTPDDRYDRELPCTFAPFQLCASLSHRLLSLFGVFRIETDHCVDN